tara:strand:- start:985 stop:1116 length:132 start_codon:yes stop_codon:yes gene_type:complete
MTVNSGLGEDSTIVVVGVGEFLHIRVKGTVSITEASQDKGEIA